MSRKLRSRTTAAAAAVAMGLSLIAIGGMPAHAGGGHSGGGYDDDVVTVATGLNNPRQLTTGHGHRLYVAEAGTADSCEAIAGAPAALQFCGLTGSVTEVRRGEQRRVVTGLPTLDLGGEVVGAADVDVRGDRIAVLVGGMAAAAALRDSQPEYAAFGTLRTGRLHWAPLDAADMRVVADVNAYELANNPDGVPLIETNATGLASRGHHRWLVTDAAGNDLLSFSRHGARTVAVFPAGDPVPNPGAPGTETSPQAVPTDVVIGPDGAYYVSELTGFPFPEGGATIWRVTRDGEVSAYATGLTMVTSLAWRGDTLYAVQLDDEGLGSPERIGSLREVTPGGSEHEAVVDGLSAPYGVAIHGHAAYVTVDSVSAGGGSVIRVDLR
ncbi:MAG: ScyD/ScyE family protein [Actinomycetota bacterium]